MSNLEKGQYFRIGYRGQINYVLDKFIDEDTNKEVYELLRPLGEAYYLDAEDFRLKKVKASYSIYDVLMMQDLIKVDFDLIEDNDTEIDDVVQLITENETLVTYIRGKKYTLEELKQKEAIISVYDSFSLSSIELNKEEIEKD